MSDDATPAKVRLTDGLGPLVERLRAGENFYAESSLWFDSKLAQAVDEAADEIERLRDVLVRIQQWADAYPVEQFPEVLRQDWQRANALLAEKGISMSAMSASNMRHVLSGVRGMVAEGLRA